MTEDGPRPAAAPEGAAPSPRPRRRWGLLALGAAALASSWNPLAAPFGLVVGLATAVLAVLALRRTPDRRRFAAAALALGVLAAIASAVLLALTAGSVGADLPGQPVVKGRTAAQLDQVLSEAAARTKQRRDRAVQELDAQRGGRATGAPAGGDARAAPARGNDRP